MNERKAWEIAYEMTKNAVPVMQTEEDREWTDGKTSIGDIDIEETRLRWITNVPGSRAPDFVFIGGIQATENMGYDVSEAEAMIPVIQKAYDEHDDVALLKLTAKLFEVLGRAPKVEGHAYWKYRYYHGFEEHLQSVDFPVYEVPDMSDEALFEKLHAGWLAQIAGAALGTIIEGYCTDRLREAFGEIRDYLRTPNTYNDDVLFELAFLEAFLLKGRDVTSENIGLEWVGRFDSLFRGYEHTTISHLAEVTLKAARIAMG